MNKFNLVLVTALILAGCGHSTPSAGKLTISSARSESVSTSVHKGTLCVQLANPENKKSFSILSTVKDIATLRIIVSGAGLTSSLSQSFTASDLQKGTAAAQFNSLAAGPYSVEVSAFDSRGVLLGRAGSTTTVVAGITTTVCLVVRLDSNVGNLGVGVTFQEVTPTVTKVDKVDCGVCDK